VSAPVLTPYRGQLLSLTGFAKAARIARNTAAKWHRAGLLSEAYVEAFRREQELRRIARETGVKPTTSYQRRERNWDVEESYTAPVGAKRERS
jgi:hypothetical protein